MSCSCRKYTAWLSRSLNNALEAGGGLGIALTVCGQTGQILVEKFRQVGAQLVYINSAGLQNARGILVIQEPEQQVLQSGVFVLALTGK
jgi:hypothetical protein